MRPINYTPNKQPLDQSGNPGKCLGGDRERKRERTGEVRRIEERADEERRTRSETPREE